ncbi:hypothetical protein NDU88_006550 [Pleurodeles waltl]|uniref:Uncharacterized protein n=1 Tax=Pleurodeles waltl TaxID=8319 RepID=A0AAV7QLF4_PLEWA|nr:hypothetical protein NDU88_006550 [Pleurodeles waltl]
MAYLGHDCPDHLLFIGGFTMAEAAIGCTAMDYWLHNRGWTTLPREMARASVSKDATTAASGKGTEGAAKESGSVRKAIDGQDTILSKPGKLASHVPVEVKEKIWKCELVDIFLLIRLSGRECEAKEKEGNDASSKEKKPKVEEYISN